LRISDRLNYQACEDITKINEENLLSKNLIVRVKYKTATLKKKQAAIVPLNDLYKVHSTSNRIDFLVI